MNPTRRNYHPYLGRVSVVALVELQDVEDFSVAIACGWSMSKISVHVEIYPLHIEFSLFLCVHIDDDRFCMRSL
jgi:hypothetical protein